MFNKIKVLLQIIIVLMPFVIAIAIPIDLLWTILGVIWNRDLNEVKENINDFNSFQKFIPTILGFILMISILFGFRLFNRKKTFNLGSGYFNYPLFYFVLAGKILGYKRVSLIRVPLYLQFNILFKDLFESIESDTHHKESDNANVYVKNIDVNSNEVNFILSDTYQIHLRNIPFVKQGLPTVFIERGTSFTGARTYNPGYSTVVREQTSKFRLKYRRVNVYATTNTQHTKEIVLQSFKNGGRTGFDKIYVYEQSNGYNFEQAHKIK